MQPINQSVNLRKTANYLDNYRKVEIPVVDVIPENPTVDVSKIINNGNPFPVSLHPRNLSNGRNASAEKIAQAEKIGLRLEKNQTFVNKYEKNAA
jgi:hypothetical protein